MAESRLEKTAGRRHSEGASRARLGPVAANAALVILYLVIALVALGALAFIAHTTAYFPIDLQVARLVQGYHATWYDLLMRAVGEPGYPPQVYVVVAWIFVVLFGAGLRWEAIAHVFATVGIGVAGLVVKLPVDRPRPNPQLIHVVNPALDGGKFSFPAGHVESYVAIFGFLLFLLIVLGRPSWLRTFEIAFFVALLALIGISRIYTGEHWFSDVIGGYLLGSIWLIATIRFYDWGKTRFFKDEYARRT